jgi:hypothetical protein
MRRLLLLLAPLLLASGCAAPPIELGKVWAREDLRPGFPTYVTVELKPEDPIMPVGPTAELVFEGTYWGVSLEGRELVIAWGKESVDGSGGPFEWRVPAARLSGQPSFFAHLHADGSHTGSGPYAVYPGK